METAIYTSITQAALLGDGFWQANVRDVAAFGFPAMASNQSQSQSQSQYQAQGQHQHQNQHQHQSQNQYQTHGLSQNQRPYENMSSTARTTAAVVPPTLASSAAQVKSEQDCFELLALEFSSLPDREMPPEISDTAAGQQQQLARPASAAKLPDHQITPNTPTNNLITNTIRAAMADIKPSS